MKKSTSLRTRIFFSMLLLITLSFGLIAVVTIYQYKKQSHTYHRERLLRKEEQIKAQINFIFSQTTYPVERDFISLIFKDEIFNIANIQNVNFNLYDINGTLLKSSQAGLSDNFVSTCLTDSILTNLSSSIEKRFVQDKKINNQGYQESFTYINDLQYKPILILNIPYFENDSFNENSLRNSLHNLSFIYILLFVITSSVAYFFSKYLTISLKTIKNKLHSTRFSKNNEKIFLKNPSAEIGELVTAYNQMIDEIEHSKEELAKNERENAWRDMAKQIAHEIKNPLTPMRLTIQNFERKFDPSDEHITEKVSDFSQSLIQHIDTLSDIASAFSYFTSLPEEQKEYIDINSVIKRTITVFDVNFIDFQTNTNEIWTMADKNQINRMLTNLLKNAIQATEHQAQPKINISTFSDQKEIIIKVEDNGVGIEKFLQKKIFEPKFTTKSTGSGLGLALVRQIVLAHKGEIELSSQLNTGAIFTIKIPKTEKN